MDESKVRAFFEGIRNDLQRAHFQRRGSIERFLSSLGFKLTTFRTAKKELDLYLSSGFNVFEHIQPDENALSDIISDMLDAQGTHGQKDLFLRQFLKAIGHSEMLSDQRCRVRREDSTNYIKPMQRRIDMTLDFGRCAVGIENKPWAIEQTDQIKDYVEHMRAKYGDFAIVYLSGDGSEPQSIDEQERVKLTRANRLIVFSYNTNLRDWLESCFKECRSEKFRWFLKDFIEYIDNKFGSNILY